MFAFNEVLNRRPNRLGRTDRVWVRWAQAVLIFVSFAVFIAPLRAQIDTGTISGFVRDPGNAPVPGARIQIAQVEIGRAAATQTDGRGFYAIPDLTPGSYSVSASAKDMETVTQTGIVLRVQDRLAIDFELPVSPAKTSIIVTAQPPVLQSETSSLGAVMDQRDVEQLPLNGLNYIQLATLLPGTSPAERSEERDTFAANGARSIQNSYLLDGVENKNKILGIDASSAQAIELSLESVLEFRVETGAYPAEFGHAAGAVVSVSIKPGTNALHGDLFEFFRNSDLDAQPYFQPVRSGTPELQQNQFGGTLGGPVIRNRTFFFFGWEGTREINAAPQLASVPTESEREGIFPATIFDPQTTVKNKGSGYVRMPFPNNTIPASRWDPVAAQLVGLYPAPNLNGALNYYSNQDETIDTNQFIGRVDHRFRDRDLMFGHYVWSGTSVGEPAVLPPPASPLTEVKPGAYSAAVSETHIFRSNLINEARVGYENTREETAVAGSSPSLSQSIPGIPAYPGISGLPTFAVTGLATIGVTGPGTLPTPETGSSNVPLNKTGQTIQGKDNLAWVHGAHTIKSGVDFEQATLYSQATLAARASFAFNGVYTQNPQDRPGTGSGFADFLLGQTSTAVITTPSTGDIRQHTFETYIQDDWKVNPRLTLNLGLRYEIPMPFYETHNNYADLILEPGPLFGTLLDAHNLAGTGYRNSFSDPNYHNFAPRAGFAYRLTPRTVIRGAAGIFYGADENLGLARRPGSNPPYYVQDSFISNQVQPNIVLSQGFPANALDLTSTTDPVLNSLPKHAPTPYVQQWTLNVQREFKGNLLAQIAYVGSSSHDLYLPVQIDSPPPGPGTLQPRRPFPEESGIWDYGPWISSNYESLQASLERRFGARLSLQASYTWSHSIDNGDDQTDINVVPPQNPNNLAAERGNSSFDLRQRFAGGWVWDLPEIPAGSGLNWVAAATRKWQLAGIVAVQTGLPFTPVLFFDPTNTGTIARPDRIGNGALPSTQQSPQNWFNEAAFVTPSAYVYGNSGRNILWGPGFRNVDLGLTRFFAIGERFRLEFRLQAFNLFNTPQLALPNAVLGEPTTGAISAVIHPQRELQLALKLKF
jgi:hypothetical protein